MCPTRALSGANGPMTELAAWILFPLIALTICTGIGLLAARVARFEAHPALVPALGFAAAIAVLGPLFQTGAPAIVGCVLLIVLAIAGYGVRSGAARGSGAAAAADSGRARMRPGWGALAGAATYALHLAPVALTGQATFLGYNLLNDTAIHLALVDWIGDHGSRFIQQAPSSYGATINDYVEPRYPLGSHELLAALKPVVGLDPAALYQPFLALCAGIAAAAIFALLRTDPAENRARARLSAGSAAVIAFAALASQLVFSFALQGSIKELAFIVCLAAAAGVMRSPALVALPAAALWSIYGIYALPWIAPIAVVVLLMRPAVRSAAIGVAVFVVAIAAYVPDSIHYYNHGHSVITSGEELGPLAGPLKVLQVAGIWLNGDYRFLPQHSWITYVLSLVVVALALFALVRTIRDRESVAVRFLVPALVAFAVTAPASSPYIDAKLLMILSPAVVVMAALGIAALPRRALAIGTAVVLGGALLISDALAYRIALPAPTDRLGELSHIDKLYGGRGPMLVNEYEEYVKHYMRRSRGSDPYEKWTAARAELRNPKLKVVGHRYDLDQMTLAFVERWRFIVLRQSPVASLPPSNYDPVWAGSWYEVWQRKHKAPAEHIPLGTSKFNPTELLDCKDLPRGKLVTVYRAPPRVIPISGPGPLPPGWYVYGQDRRMLEIHKGGRIVINAGGSAPDQLWLRGRTTRDDSLLGVRVPRTLQRISEWIRIDPSPLNSQMDFTRPKRSARPGDAQPDIVGPFVAVLDQPPRLARGPEVRSFCDRPVDWVDVYRSSNHSG
jgi:hypothetical protein